MEAGLETVIKGPSRDKQKSMTVVQTLSSYFLWENISSADIRANLVVSAKTRGLRLLLLAQL